MNNPDNPEAAKLPSDAELNPLAAAGAAGATPPTRTPMYEAAHAERYQRQALIRSIQAAIGRCVICYVSASAASIDRDDTLGFVEMLHNLPAKTNVDLLLHTAGGDIDAAEKLAVMVRSAVAQSELRVVIPDYAKSAGTLLAIGADSILMSDSSELGPIDPQVVLRDANGNLIRHSILSYLAAYETHAQALRVNANDVVSRIMLAKLEPATVTLFQSVKTRAQKLAEDQLKFGMFRGKTANFTKIATDLMDPAQFPTHGQMIGWQAATQLGLTVAYVKQSDENWRQYWLLYCLQRLSLKDRQKLFESEYASLTLDSKTA